jgi:small-conductance mechanosensitive channel
MEKVYQPLRHVYHVPGEGPIAMSTPFDPYISGIFGNPSAISFADELVMTLAVVAAIYFLFKLVLEKVAIRGIADPKAKYSFRKAVSIIGYFVIIVAVTGIWVQNLQTLAIFYGLIVAGAAVVLQDFLRNFVGGIVIFTVGLYRIGDRVQVGTKYGDVIDIGVFYTTLMEIREWVAGDQPSGRLSIMPNSFVLSNVVNNYTKDHDFIFDEITLYLTPDSDWKKATGIVAEIVRQETGTLTEQARVQIEAIGEKYYLQRKVVEPAIYTSLSSTGIQLSVRYVASVRDRRTIRDAISRDILEEFQGHPGVKVALIAPAPSVSS